MLHNMSDEHVGSYWTDCITAKGIFQLIPRPNWSCVLLYYTIHARTYTQVGHRLSLLLTLFVGNSSSCYINLLVLN